MADSVAHSAAPLDTVRRVAMPEGCELNLRLAGPMVRARAWLIDAFFRLVIFLIAAMVLGYFERLGGAIMMLIFFGLEWFYPIIFEVFWRGMTPGKKYTKLAVLHDDGTPIGWGASFARNTLRAVDFLPLGYAFGLFSMWFNRDYKRLGDLLAGTVVVYRGDDPIPAIDDDFDQVEMPPFPLALSEQRAIIEYRQRAPKLTAERAGELALLAKPLTDGLQPEAAMVRLWRIANALLGKHAPVSIERDSANPQS